MSKKTHSADSNSDIEWSIEAMKQAFYDASEHCEEVYKELNKQNEIKKMDSKDLKNLTEEYSKISEAYTVTKADKKGNTPAYQGYMAGKKNVKTGDHCTRQQIISKKKSWKLLVNSLQKRLKKLWNGKKMMSPFNVVKNTRQSYDRFHREVITEVEVQFGEERSAWIPLETLIAIQNHKSLTI